MQQATALQPYKPGWLSNILDVDTADFWLQKLNPIWSLQQAMGKIVEKNWVSKDSMCLLIKTNRHFRMGQAGQHHPIKINIQERYYQRSYSLSQLDAQHVQLTVKRVKDGLVSNWLCDRAQKGDIVLLGEPFGDMTISASPAQYVLLAAGSGITPMYSMVQALEKKQQLSQYQIDLLYWVKRPEDASYLAYFEKLAQRYAQFNFQAFYSQAEQADARLNAQHIAQFSQSQPVVYACGPSGFVQSAQQLFADNPLFKSEAFYFSRVAGDAQQKVVITLTKSKQQLTIARGESILSALEQQNIRPEHGCRMGICNKCACHKSQGVSKNLLNGAEHREADSALKLCVNSAESDISLDL
ncbi:ferredoxin reductase [Acinetobacter larvae]|uniref:Oxidoreductase n=1 Tax=Acinetobacter larvae TaxID=1789224 RepID=A0A1B2M1B9_9GAMM|nr:ferredoxin reductase [Acinetobacter larvae]AOA58996.1 oxidoreductase [Acinetobacter larvae]